jgi:2-dehydrotetronate isomerase
MDGDMPRFAANLNFLFTEVPFLDRFDAAANAGFKAVEIGNPYEASAGEIAARLRANGLALVLFNTSAGDAAAGERGRSALAGREKDFDADLTMALSYAEATGCKLIHVMAGLVHQGARREVFVANLKKAARKAASAGVSLVVEPINRRDIPGYFLNKLAEARAIIYEVGEPNLGLQFDIYHRQVEDGDVAVALKEYAGLTRHYQIANPPDRGEPDAGDLNFAWLLKEIDASGYTGWIGCEYRPRRGTVEGLKWAAACGVKLG